MVFVTLYSFGTEDLFRNRLSTRANSNYKVAFFSETVTITVMFLQHIPTRSSVLGINLSFHFKNQLLLKSYVRAVILHRTSLFTGNWSLPLLPSVFEGKTGKNGEKYCEQLYWWHLMYQCCIDSNCNSISLFWKISKQMYLMKIWENVKATKWALTERQ